MSGRNKANVVMRTNWKAVVQRLSSGNLSFEQEERGRHRAGRTTYVARFDDGIVKETVELVVMSDALENGVVTITDEHFGDYMITFDIAQQGIRMSINSSVYAPPVSVLPLDGALVFEQLALAAAEAAGQPFQFTPPAISAPAPK